MSTTTFQKDDLVRVKNPNSRHPGRVGVVHEVADDGYVWVQILGESSPVKDGSFAYDPSSLEKVVPVPLSTIEQLRDGDRATYDHAITSLMELAPTVTTYTLTITQPANFTQPVTTGTIERALRKHLEPTITVSATREAF